MTFSVTVQLGQSLLKRTSDLIFLLLTVLLVHWLHVSVMVVLLGVGAVTVWWYRPRRSSKEAVRP